MLGYTIYSPGKGKQNQLETRNTKRDGMPFGFPNNISNCFGWFSQSFSEQKMLKNNFWKPILLCISH